MDPLEKGYVHIKEYSLPGGTDEVGGCKYGTDQMRRDPDNPSRWVCLGNLKHPRTSPSNPWAFIDALAEYSNSRPAVISPCAPSAYEIAHQEDLKCQREHERHHQEFLRTEESYRRYNYELELERRKEWAAI